jgi:hypothetical protein
LTAALVLDVAQELLTELATAIAAVDRVQLVTLDRGQASPSRSSGKCRGL